MGDQGIDIIATKGSLKYGFQCKYYSGTVGNDAVQQAFSGIAYYKLDKAVVITNSDFSSGARKLAEEVDVLLWDHVEPMEEDSRYTLYQVMAILFFGWSIIQLYQILYSTEPTKDYQFISYSLLFISSFLQAIPHHARIATSIALILSSIHAYMYSVQKTFSLFTLDYYQIALFVFILITSFDWFTTLKSILYEDKPINAISYVKYSTDTLYNCTEYGRDTSKWIWL